MSAPRAGADQAQHPADRSRPLSEHASADTLPLEKQVGVPHWGIKRENSLLLTTACSCVRLPGLPSKHSNTIPHIHISLWSFWAAWIPPCATINSLSSHQRQQDQFSSSGLHAA